ncbi:hypothetical protein Micbo1qcDRAFT_191385 [Microdochium bolleyi]|uniref:BZIP domain-containing protein n=1 Tax=Microdochium bolleyi TaxID=196109 RepID=A0A136JHS9_9PEZI|nr:hypothetical protein Micbo1qcDRAFT_191385 [Microdochium bolleyi]
MSQPQLNQGGIADPLDLLDFSEYDGLPYQSPSPSTSSKSQFPTGPATSMSITPPTLPSSQPMSGPSHKYDQYKQQTPFVPGALASTIAVNQNNADITGYNLEYMSPGEDLFDFNSNPSHSRRNTEMDVDFEASEPGFYYAAEPTINPNAIGASGSQLTSPSMVAPPSNVGRMYPGMHQQAALAKAQAQQRQQRQIIQQQQAERQQTPAAKQQRSKAPMPADPIVEQKITQLLNSMRSKANAGDDDEPSLHMARTKKEEDDMDEDERLLASEEGKKLSSKERRQLRNKVSARAFRSRRKEYITQLESEIATKVTENGDLRAQNRALMEENRRLSDLTRMLLSSSSFSTFLDQMGTAPTAITQPQQQAPVVEQRQGENQQIPKDVNPYVASLAQQTQPQQIGMAMIPETSMDFSMLNMDNSTSYSYQPQVFTVLETPSFAGLDAATLSEKPSVVCSGLEDVCTEVKTMAPQFETPVPSTLAKPVAPKCTARNNGSDNEAGDLDGDIFDDEQDASAIDISSLIFGTISSEKSRPQYQLVDASVHEAEAAVALRKVEKLSASLEATMARLNMLTDGL